MISARQCAWCGKGEGVRRKLCVIGTLYPVTVHFTCWPAWREDLGRKVLGDGRFFVTLATPKARARGASELR
jgi:hypothetical protein